MSDYYIWTDDLRTISGAIAKEENLLELPDEMVRDLVRIASELACEGMDIPVTSKNVKEQEAEFLPGGSMTLWAVPKDTKLYNLLVEWNDGSEDALVESVSYGFEDDENLYFASGCGYDVMSQDLLGGTMDGQAHRDFDKFVDEQTNQIY